MNFTQILKKSIILILFSVFLACSIISLKNLLAKKIGYSVSFETRKAIGLPSWTLCPFSHSPQDPFYNKSNVKEFTQSLATFALPINFTVNAEEGEEDDKNYKAFNMTDEKILKKHFNATMAEVWNIHCKVNYFAKGCDPCLTFSAPRKGVGKFSAHLNIAQKNPKWETMVLLLHDRDASLALNWEYNWNQVLYFIFKPGKT